MSEERIDPPRVGDERTILETWLDWQRATLAIKCDGLDAAQMRMRTAEPSPMSLLGLVRHMAEVERGWFRRCLDGQDVKPIWSTREDPDADFLNVAGADADSDMATWLDEVAQARAVLSGIRSLDEVGTTRKGGEVSARWVLVHMIEEYARHNGHADLIRERIDGATGY
jgi:uncharacterized damage-inducible protein DinB